MATFDFIEQKDFRTALTADYAEMKNALQSESWKSVQVMAGSIVETILVDYLVSTSVQGRRAGDPLRMNLIDIVDICKGEGVISDRTADLCSVIRSYRNLIHPGRAIRLQELPPDKDSANVAAALVHIIATEIGRSRAQRLGMTAEQIISKLRRDENSLSILKHLLADANETQRLALLLEALPSAHQDLMHEEDYEAAGRLSKAFKTAFKLASSESRQMVAGQFVQKVKEADTSHVEWYRDAFFFSGFVPFLQGSTRELVVDYLFGRITVVSGDSLSVFKGLGSILAVEDAARWTSLIVRKALQPRTSEERREEILKMFGSVHQTTSAEFDVAVGNELDSWLDVYNEENEGRQREIISGIKEWIEDIPF